MTVRKLKPYMAYCGDPADGAVLVFANTVKEARKVGFGDVAEWSGCSFIEVDVNELGKDDPETLEYLMSLAKKSDPHCIDNPPTCETCERWGARLNGRFCGFCS